MSLFKWIEEDPFPGINSFKRKFMLLMTLIGHAFVLPPTIGFNVRNASCCLILVLGTVTHSTAIRAV